MKIGDMFLNGFIFVMGVSLGSLNLMNGEVSRFVIALVGATIFVIIAMGSVAIVAAWRRRSKEIVQE